MTKTTSYPINKNPRIRVIERDILVFESLFSWGPDLIRTANEIGGWIPSVEVEQGKGTRQTDKRTSDQIHIVGDDNPRLAPFEDAVFNVVGNAADRYVRRNPYMVVSKDDGYSLLRYKKGSFYKEHIDCYSHDENRRTLSVVLYLNDDYEGGEIAFPRHAVTLKPKAGSVLMFPSIGTHPHESREVTDGVKYSVVTWMQ